MAYSPAEAAAREQRGELQIGDQFLAIRGQ